MVSKIKISLEVPNAAKENRHFSFRLKQYGFQEMAEYSQPKRVVALSNLNGDFRSMCKTLMRYGIINKRLKWIFSDGHVVILGNCFYEIDASVECLWLIYALEDQARMEGGYLHYILGPNEIKNLNGNWRFGHPHYAKPVGNGKRATSALYNGNRELWSWLKTKNVVEKIGDKLFCYGNIFPLIGENPSTIQEINRSYRALFQLSAASLNSNFFENQNLDTINHDFPETLLKRFAVSSIVVGGILPVEAVNKYKGKVISLGIDYSSEHPSVLLIKRNGSYEFLAGD